MPIKLNRNEVEHLLMMLARHSNDAQTSINETYDEQLRKAYRDAQRTTNQLYLKFKKEAAIK